MQVCDTCDAADPTLGGHELGTTATERTFFADIYVLLCLIAKILCQSWQVIPASSGISVLLELFATELNSSVNLLFLIVL